MTVSIFELCGPSMEQIIVDRCLENGYVQLDVETRRSLGQVSHALWRAVMLAWREVARRARARLPAEIRATLSRQQWLRTKALLD